MEKLSKSKLFSLGLQHVLAMYAGAVIVPILVGTQVGLDQKGLAYLVSIDLLCCGLATLLQVWTNRFFGIGLPVVLGCTFTAVGPMINIGKEHGMSAIYGSILASGLFVIVFGGLFGKLSRFFPPVVTGSVVTVIGITLIPNAMYDMGGGQGSADFGHADNLLLSFGVLLVILVMNRFFTGFLRTVSILIGLIAGSLAGAMMGKIDYGKAADAHWLHMVKPFYFGTPTFEFSSIVTMIIVAIVSIVESTGVFMALSQICERKLDSKDLGKGYRAEGLAILIGGIFNSFPYTTYSQNVGLVQLTKVRNRKVIAIAGCILVLLGFIPKVAAVTTMIPSPVLGGAMLAMFGMVISAGIKMLGQVDMNDHENMLIVACSVGMGLGVTVVPDLFAKLPDNLQILTNSGIVAGSLTAILLNLLFHVGRKKQAGQSESTKPEAAEASTPLAG